MNKITQICICIACAITVIVCLIIAFQRPTSPDIDFIKQWDKEKQAAIDKAVEPLEEKINELEEKNEELQRELDAMKQTHSVQPINAGQWELPTGGFGSTHPTPTQTQDDTKQSQEDVIINEF